MRPPAQGPAAHFCSEPQAALICPSERWRERAAPAGPACAVFDACNAVGDVLLSPHFTEWGTEAGINNPLGCRAMVAPLPSDCAQGNRSHCHGPGGQHCHASARH